MSWIWDFIKGFGRSAKQATTGKSWTTEAPDQEDIKWYWQLESWELVWVVEDDRSRWEKAWDTIWNAAGITWWFISNAWDNSNLAPVSWLWWWDKQHVDDQLLWLQYEWKDVTLWERDNYMNMLSQYQYLSNLENPTIDQAVAKQKIDNELQKYTVADYDDDNEWDWENTWLGKLLPDSWRNEAAKNHSKRKKVDTQQIIDTIADNQKIWNYFEASSPEQLAAPEEEMKLRFFREDEFQKEMKQEEVDNIIKNKINDVTQKALEDPNFKITGRENEIINEDTIQWLFENAMWVDGISTVMESYKNLYKKLDDTHTPVLKQLVQDKIEGMIDMLYYQFSQDDKTSKEAFFEYTKEHWVPLNLDLSEKYDQMNDYEQWLVDSINSIFWIIPVGHKDYWLFSVNDWADKADALSRMINVSKSNYAWRAANLLMLTSTQVTWLWQVLVDWLIWSVDAAQEYIRNWDLTYDDYKSYLYWYQTPDVFTVKEKFQEYAMPESWPQKYWTLIYESLWLVDDLTSIFAPLKMSLPVKAATADKVVAVIPKIEKWVNATTKAVTKWAKVAAKTEKVATKTAKVETATEEIVTKVQKATWQYDKTSFIQKTKDAANRLIQRYKDWRAAKQTLNNAVKSAWDQVILWTKNSSSLLWENVARWVAEETFQSLWFQWMTSYDYEDTDLVFDIAWAMFSWFMRTREFMNKTWMMKYQALNKNKIWWVWYLREAAKMWDDEVLKAMWISKSEFNQMSKHLTDADIEELWAWVSQVLWWLIETWEKVSQSAFSSKIQKLSSTSRQAVNNNLRSLIDWANDDLIRKLRYSTNPKYSSMVKEVKKVDPNTWKKVKVREYNRPESMTDKQWYKKLDNARKKAYSPGGLDGKTSYASQINNIKQYVKKNLPALAKNSRYVENVNWVYRFKKRVTQAQKERLYRKVVVDRLRWAGIELRSENKIFLNEYKVRSQRSKVFQSLYNAGIWDELENPLWRMWQRLAIYVNDYLTKKIFWKDALVKWLNGFWASVWQAFEWWLKEYKHIWDYHDLTLKEIRQMIILFWKTFDEKISKEFMVKAKIFNEKWFMKNSKEMLINMPYEKAIEINPDLAYMWVVMFNKIISSTDDAISELEKELKLRSYKWDPKNSWRVENEFYWIAKKASTWKWLDWTKVFNDHYEEKKLMWKKWKLYLKLNKDGRDKVIQWVNDWNIFDRKVNPNWKWVIEIEYENPWMNVLKEGRKEYNTISVYTLWTNNPKEWRKLIWYLRTFSDPIMKEWKDASKAWWDTRYMNIEFIDDTYKNMDFESSDFSLYRDSTEEPLIKEFDMSRDFDSTDIAVADSTFDPSQVSTNKKQTPLKTWNDVVLHVIKNGDWSVESWEEFSKILPWRTDRVPYEFYNYVMELPENIEFSKHKINLLLSMMYNDNVTQTVNWVKINMNTRHQFKTNDVTIRYRQKTKNKKWSYITDEKEYTIKSDWRITIWNRSSWVVVIQKDARSAPEVFIYSKRDWTLTDIYDLYRLDDEALQYPAWEFMFNWRDLNAYIRNWKNKERVIWSMEFVSNISSKERAIDIDAMVKVAKDDVDDTIRLWNIEKKVKVSSANPDLYDEMYRRIYWKDMPMRLKSSFRSMKWMTPERFFNNVISNFEHSRFWRFFLIDKSQKRENVADQLKRINRIVNELEEFSKRLDTWLTDAQLVEIFKDYTERIAQWSFKLTDEEIEIRKMMYPHQSNNINLDKFVRISWYRRYWKIPSEMKTKPYQMLRDRRDRILAHRLWAKEISMFDDDVKDLLIERHFWQWWFYKTDAELEKDILDHPDDYRSILQAYWKKVQEYDERVKLVWELDSEIEKLNKEIEELESKIPAIRKRKVSAIAKEKREFTRDVLHWVLQDELIRAREELVDLIDRFEIERTEELNNQIQALREKIKELEEWDYLYNEVKNYRSQVWDIKSITKEQWDDIIDRNITWKKRWYKPHKMWAREINRRIMQINDKLPNARILNYDPDTKTINTTWMTDQEIKFVEDHIRTATAALQSWNVTAAHIRNISAIVINPKMLQEADIWHEWFHEAIALVWDEWFNWRVKRVFDQVRDKFQKEIEKNAENLWYDKMYLDWTITQSKYKKIIIEEWLAERFAEFINWKYYEEFDKASNSFIKEFFIELWNRIKLMFSETEVVELFDDIYNWLKNDDELKVGFNATEVDWWWVSYRSISRDWLNHIRTKDSRKQGMWFGFWDILWFDVNENELAKANMADLNKAFLNKWWAKDVLVAISHDFTARWNYLWAARTNVTLPDWRVVKTSYLDIFESITDEARSVEIDDALDKIYWWPTSKVEVWLDTAIRKLQWWSDYEYLKWNLFNEDESVTDVQKFDEFPITAELSKDAEWYHFTLKVNNIEVHRVNASYAEEPVLKDKIWLYLSWERWEKWKKEVSRILESNLANRSWLTLPREKDLAQALRTRNVEIKVAWWTEVVDMETAIKALWDALWNSINENYSMIVAKEFQDRSPLIIWLSQELYRIYLYDRLIPHLWKSGLKNNIFEDLYKKKEERTEYILGMFHTYMKSKASKWLLNWSIWYDWSRPVIQFSFWNNPWTMRKIWWHLKSEKTWVDMLESLRSKGILTDAEFNQLYDTTTQRFKNTNKLDSRWWNVSPLSLDYKQFSKYYWKWFVWENFKQNYRQWYNNTSDDTLQIRFSSNREKEIPVINEDWTPWVYKQQIEQVDLNDYMDWAMIPDWYNKDDYYVYLFWDEKIPVIMNKNDPWFMVTKWIKRDAVAKLLKRWRWIWSSSAISKEWYWDWWDVTLIWKKIIPSFKTELYWWATIWLWDFWSPMREHLVNAWFLRKVEDIKNEYWSFDRTREMLNYEDLSRMKDNVKVNNMFSDIDISLADKDNRNNMVDFLQTNIDNIRNKWTVPPEVFFDDKWRWVFFWDLLREWWWDVRTWLWDDVFSNTQQYSWSLPESFEESLIDLFHENPEILDWIYHDLYWWKISATPSTKSTIRPSHVSDRVINLLNDQTHKRLQEFYDANIPYANRFFEYMDSAREFKDPFIRMGSRLNQEWFLSLDFSRNWFMAWLEKMYPDEAYELNNKDIETLLSYYTIKKYKWDNNYYEIYNRDLDVWDYWWMVVKVDDIDHYKELLERNKYKYVVAPIDASKEELENLARQVASERKWLVIIPWWEWWAPLVDINNINRVNFRRSKNWTTDDDLINKKEKFTPITFSTYDWHVENIKRLNEINRRNWISINKASPDDIKKMESYRYEIKKKWRKTSVDNAMRREYKERLRQLYKDRDDSVNMRNSFSESNRQFEESKVYEEIRHIWDVIKENEEAQRLIKSSNTDPDVVSAKSSWENNSIKYDKKEEKKEEKLKEGAEDSIVKAKEDLHINPSKYEQSWWNKAKDDWWSIKEEQQSNIWWSEEDDWVLSFLNDISEDDTAKYAKTRDEILDEIRRDLDNPEEWEEIYNTWRRFILRTKVSKAETYTEFKNRVKDEIQDFMKKEYTIWNDERKFQRRMKSNILKLQEEEQRVWYVMWKRVYDWEYREHQQTIVEWKRDKYTEKIMEHYNVDQYRADEIYREFEASANAEYAYTKNEISRLEDKENTYLKRTSKKIDKANEWDYSWFIDKDNIRHRYNKRENWEPQEEDVQSVVNSVSVQTQSCPVKFIKK